MNNIDIEKNKLRQKYIVIRTNIKNKKTKSKIITQKIIEDEDYKRASVVALYKSMKSEVDLNLLLQHAFNNNKTIALPKVIGNELKFYKISSINETLIKSKFGVEEPAGIPKDYVPSSKIDLIIVPGICFDKQNNRLGFGRGYYDRYLKTCKANYIGICFKEQIVDFVPTTSYDIKVKKVITD